MADSNYSIGKSIYSHERFSTMQGEQLMPSRPVWIHRLTLYYTDNNRSIEACIERLKRWAQWQNPLVLEIYDCSCTESEIIFVTRKPEGKSLDNLLTDHTHFDFKVALKVGIQMAQALNFLHQQNEPHGKLDLNCFIYEKGNWMVLANPGWGIKLNSMVEEYNRGIISGNGDQRTPQVLDIAHWGSFLGSLITGERMFGFKNMGGRRLDELDLDTAMMFLKKTELLPDFQQIIINALNALNPKENGFKSMDEICNALRKINM